MIEAKGVEMKVVDDTLHVTIYFISDGKDFRFDFRRSVMAVKWFIENDRIMDLVKMDMQKTDLGLIKYFKWKAISREVGKTVKESILGGALESGYRNVIEVGWYKIGIRYDN